MLISPTLRRDLGMFPRSGAEALRAPTRSRQGVSPRVVVADYCAAIPHCQHELLRRHHARQTVGRVSSHSSPKKERQQRIQHPTSSTARRKAALRATLNIQLPSERERHGGVKPPHSKRVQADGQQLDNLTCSPVRAISSAAPTGLAVFLSRANPGLAPWATIFRPHGAAMSG